MLYQNLYPLLGSEWHFLRAEDLPTQKRRKTRIRIRAAKNIMKMFNAETQAEAKNIIKMFNAETQAEEKYY